VLHYEHLPLDEPPRGLGRRASTPDQAWWRRPPKLVRLPVCTDRDDQKFLEVARDAGAAVLITKDKALLKLARKTAQAGLFRIMVPEAWLKTGKRQRPTALEYH
jgi:hypothetical protein